MAKIISDTEVRMLGIDMAVAEYKLTNDGVAQRKRWVVSGVDLDTWEALYDAINSAIESNEGIV